MKQKILQWSMLVVSLVMMAACSDNGNMKGLLEMIPEDADYVATGNVETILKSAGGSLDGGKIKLPAFADEVMSRSDQRDLDELNDKLKNSGVDIDACAIGGYYRQNQPFLILALNDIDKFKKLIEEEDFREDEETDGVVYYKKTLRIDYDDSKKVSYIAVKGSYACIHEGSWYGDSNESFRQIRKFMENANEANYAGTTFGDYICEGNVGGVAIRIPHEMRNEMRRAGMPSSTLEMVEGVVCIKGDLTAETATVKVKMFGEDGKEKDISKFKDMYDMSAKINKDALAYMNKNEALVMAMSMKNVKWDDYMKQMSAGMSRQERGILDIVKGFLEKIDGTIAVGVGVTDGWKSIVNLAEEYQMLSNLSFTFVIETKDGKAKSMINDCRSFFDTAGLPYETTANGLAFDIDTDCKVYLQTEGNFIVLSNHKIEKGDKNATVEGLDFSSYITAGGIILNRDNRLMKDMDLKYDVKLFFTSDIENMETTLTYEINGGDSDEGVIAKTIRMCKDIAAQSRYIESMREEVREKECGDYMAMDSVAVDSALSEDYYEVAADSAAW